MASSPFWLSDADFNYIYNKVPRCNVDLVIRSAEGILFSCRTIEPNKGMWHLPGGTIYKTERIEDAAKRNAHKETGLEIRIDQLLGYMEFPSERRGSIDVHTISLVIASTPMSGTLKANKDASELKYIKILPEACIPEHADFLRKHALHST